MPGVACVACRIGVAGGNHVRQRLIRIDGQIERQAQAARRDTIEDCAAHLIGKFAQVFECHPGAIRGTPQVERTVTERASYLIEVGHCIDRQVVRHVDPFAGEFCSALGQCREHQLWVELAGEIGDSTGRRTRQRR